MQLLVDAPNADIRVTADLMIFPGDNNYTISSSTRRVDIFANQVAVSGKLECWVPKRLLPVFDDTALKIICCYLIAGNNHL